MISFERAHERLRHDPETGELYWKIDFWKKVKAGKIAGDRYKNGYRRVCVDSKEYLAHRLIWMMHSGIWPEAEIDHINGVRDDNRIENLRLATSGQNKQNAGIRADNTSGEIGVSWFKVRGKWRADICGNGAQKYLGAFDTIKEASDAYKKAKAELHTFNPEPRKTE